MKAKLAEANSGRGSKAEMEFVFDRFGETSGGHAVKFSDGELCLGVSGECKAAEGWIEVSDGKDRSVDGEETSEGEEYWIADIEGTLKATYLLEEPGGITAGVLYADHWE